MICCCGYLFLFIVGLATTCNDWKEFDSAIVTTSRHYPLIPNLPPIRDHFTTNLQQQQQLGPLRSPHDFTTNSNAFSSFTTQLQQQQQHHQQQSNFTNFPQQQQQQQLQQQQQQPNLSWFSSELNTQISTPPGFRNTNQATKQQEC